MDELKKEVIISVSTDTSEAESGIKKIGDGLKEVNNTNIDKPFKSIKAEIKAASEQAQQMAKNFGKNSEQFTTAAKKVANLKDQFQEYNKTVEAFNPDNKLQALVSVGKAGVGAIQGVAGAMTLLGVESEDTQKTIAKLQALMSLSDALNSIDDIKNAYSNFNSVIKSSSALQQANNMLNSASVGIIKALGFSVDGTSTAVKGLSTAFKTIGIGLIIAGIVALVENFDKIKVALGFATQAQEKFNAVSKEANKASVEAASKAIQSVNEVRTAFELARKGVISKDEALKKYNDTLGDSFGKTNSLSTAENLLAAKADAYIEMTMNKAKANVFFAKAAEVAATGLTASTEDQTGFWDKAKVGVLNYFGAYSEGLNTAITAQKNGVSEVKKTSDELEKIFTDQGKMFLKKSEEGGNTAGIKSADQIALEKQREKDYEKAQADAKAKAEKAAELLKSEREKLKAHQEEIRKITNDALKLNAESSMNEREKELAAIEEHFADEYKIITKSFTEQVKIIEAELKRKAITYKQYAEQYAFIEKNAGVAVNAITEEKGIKNLEVEKKYNTIIADFINGYQTNAYQESRAKLISDFDEKIKIADEKQKALLEILKKQEVEKLDTTETLRKNTINSETNLVTTETENVISETDTPEQRVAKLQAIYDAEKAFKDAKFQEELARLAGDEEQIALLKAQYNQQELESKKALTDAKKALDSEERDNTINKLTAVGQATNTLGALIGKQTVAGKALGIATALINTYTGATEVLRAKSVLPEPLGSAAKIISAAAIIANGIKTVKSITAVQVPGGASGGGAGAASAPTLTAPQINSTLLSPELTAIKDVRVVNQQDQVVKAYISDRDLQNNENKKDFFDKLGSI